MRLRDALRFAPLVCFAVFLGAMTIHELTTNPSLPDGAHGTWVMQSVDGDDADAFDGRSLWLEVDGQTVTGSTFCGEFWMDYRRDRGPSVRGAACLPPFDGPDLNELGRNHRTAIAHGATWDDERLVFSARGLTFTYERPSGH